MALTLTTNYAEMDSTFSPAKANPLLTSLSDTSMPPGTVAITTKVDLLGRVVAYTDAWNATTTSTYDLAGRLTDTADPRARSTSRRPGQ